jgi:hypothetical protein
MPRAGPEVQDTHAGPDAAGAEEPFGRRVQQRCLRVEPPLLFLTVPENVLLRHRPPPIARKVRGVIAS